MLRKAILAFEKGHHEIALTSFAEAAAIYGDHVVKWHIKECQKRIRSKNVVNMGLHTGEVGVPLSSIAPQQEKPESGRELLSAHLFGSRSERYSSALEYADTFVPEKYLNSINMLRANVAIKNGDYDEWKKYVNLYLSHFGIGGIELSECSGKGILHRLNAPPFRAILSGPLVSVIMPAWNAEKSIQAAANSILKQTWKKLELLIIDDASDDGTWGEMQKIASMDDRVRIFRNPVNVGPYVSKNILLSKARGEYITGHDSDDWAHPQHLERLMGVILKSENSVLACTFSMLRLEPNGFFDRFAPVGSFSFDGVAREAPISLIISAELLKTKFGSWDCVRFGADSELLSRIEHALGSAYRKVDCVTLLCMNYEGSLTNNRSFGVDRLTGPSEARRNYASAWMQWHKNVKSRGQTWYLPFPPVPGAQRPFPAPKEANVAWSSVRRNHAFVTGDDAQLEQGVTAICVTKRPYFFKRIREMMSAQTYQNLRLIVVVHGDIDESALTIFNGMPNLRIIRETDKERTLGECLNLALAQCETDLVAKIDDDDFYGPNYIRGCVAAFTYNDYENVAIVGKERAYCYIEALDLFGLRLSKSHQNSIRDRVFGATIFWSRRKLKDQRFKESNTGEDSDFYSQALQKGAKILSIDPYDYVCIRYDSPQAHTWVVEPEVFSRSVVPSSRGVRLDIAYSSQSAPSFTRAPARF